MGLHKLFNDLQNAGVIKAPTKSLNAIVSPGEHSIKHYYDGTEMTLLQFLKHMKTVCKSLIGCCEICAQTKLYGTPATELLVEIEAFLGVAQ